MADMNVLKEYAFQGWSLVPLARGQKHPTDGGWLKNTYALQDFNESSNIGVKLGNPSGGLNDVDLDCPEAVALAKLLLPATGAVFGRASKPASHYLFIVQGTKPRAFKGPDGQVLLEIRSTGGQTMFPGSIHPSGEPVSWESNRAPMSMAQPDFELAVARLAVATLIAKNWPSGSRHVAAGHLGGVLGRCGYSPFEVEQTVHAIVTSLGEGQWADDNARFARESAEKLEDANAKVTGGPAFSESFPNGKAILRLIYEWLGREGDDQVDKLNEKHFVTILGKDMVVGTEDEDGVVFQTFEGFERRYYNNFIGKKKLGRFWLEHERCRKYSGVVFAPPPTKVKEGVYNLWRGFAVEPAPEVDTRPITRYLEHVKELVCSGNEIHAKFVLDLLAITVQQPGTPTGKALALRGGQGLGKSVFVKSFGRLFGHHFTTVSSRKHITGEFNAHLSGKVVVFADEAIWGGNRQDVGTLKRLITEDTIVVERKGIDSCEEKNCMHLFMATNEEWVFPAGDQERRGVILDMSRKETPEYYAALWDETRDPAFLPALLAFLQARDVSDGFWRKGLDTAGLREQQDLTADPVRQWWSMKLDDGRLGPVDGWAPFVSNEWLYQDFLRDMGHHGAGAAHRETRRSLGKKLRKLLPAVGKTEIRRIKMNVAPYGAPHYEYRTLRGYVMPSLAECRGFYDKLTGTKNVWEEPVVAEADPELMQQIEDLEKDEDL